MKNITNESSNRKVLLIDDTDIDLYISKKIISAFAFAKEVTTKSSAIEALEFLKENIFHPEVLPDIIFLDIRMPIMDGFGFLEEFKKLPLVILEKCKIIMLSSSIDICDIDRAASYKSVKKFLNKPLSEQVLSALDNDLLKQAS